MTVTNNTNTQTTLHPPPTSRPPPGPWGPWRGRCWWSGSEVASCCLVSPAELTRSLSRLNIRQKLKSEDKSLSILLMRWNVCRCQSVTAQIPAYHHLIVRSLQSEENESLMRSHFLSHLSVVPARYFWKAGEFLCWLLTDPVGPEKGNLSNVAWNIKPEQQPC